MFCLTHRFYSSLKIASKIVKKGVWYYLFNAGSDPGIDRLRILELGAGVGLPGIDLARRGIAQTVTLTDRNEFPPTPAYALLPTLTHPSLPPPLLAYTSPLPTLMNY